MLNIIRSDIYRILRSPAFYIAFLLIFIFTGLSTYTVQPGQFGMVEVTNDDIEPMGNKLDDMSIDEMGKITISEYRGYMLESTNYKLDKAIMKKNFNMYYIFIFAAVLAITADFAGGSVKNTLSSAISRKKYFVSKFVVVAINTLVFFLVYVYGNYFSNRIFNNANLASDIGVITKMMLMQLPLVIALSSVLCGAAFLFKKTAIFNTVTIAAGFMYPVVLTLVGKILSMKPEKVFRFEFGAMFNKLASTPSNSYVIVTYIACAVIIAASALIGWMSFGKSEIK